MLLLCAGCLASPRRTQILSLLDQLDNARSLFSEQPPRTDQGCTEVGDVQTRLYGEPGLHDQPGWPRLRDAANALNAVCGQDTMLAQPSTDSPAMQAAQTRWQQGIQRELRVACDHLRAAASELGREKPC